MPDLTVKEAAAAAGVSERTMRRWIRDGRLAGCYKVGGRVRIPERAIREAVWGMLPKGPLGRRVLKKLKIYKTAEHDHAAQKPRVLEIKN